MSTVRESSQAPGPKTSAARDRLLRVASELFYREGIRGVGMDRVLAEAKVTRATMYRHFSGKEALVAACLRREDEIVRAAFAAALGGVPASDGPARLVESIADDFEHRHTRGCPFINAGLEYPDAASPVRVIVAEHRAWFRGLAGDVLAARAAAAAAAETAADAAAAGPDRGADADATAVAADADALVLLRDGALVGAHLDDAVAVRTAFTATARRLLAL
ncbi:TetR/AcrR family transcriptional regulator [Herbiconiux solani]|uniref:TetR/AcrR family transcriptional regulator n=1 Tax=Herbiconiux solani TaxID=661329 RepID=UPI000824395A|nr:TetR/AcrR family transcriptional regulator [Herbiconiux solani]